ncbi:retrovirus-related pol polyprotein from transposon TNT 1-94 [Tanacetum coccineum]|uniref:Retrovirus-related pol polyprotein from transposon TNT 1-94 n=1 Tax=Tanacetum coccineum TaxID=301880 RepID=A0ABQ5GI79_9ASTR
MHTIVWRNKPELETLSLDDLFNNLKVYKIEVKGTSSSATNSHNVAFFVPRSSTKCKQKLVNTAALRVPAITQNVENLSDAMFLIPSLLRQSRVYGTKNLKIITKAIHIQELKDKGVIDSRCSRHMTGNRSYLTDYEEIDRICVTLEKFERRKIYREKDFKLTDESHVLLKVPREDNMYSVDLKNVVSQGGIENLIYLKVKVIRYDNETEFKNRVMNQFCKMKSIKREFSVARTLQQNGVAQRKNRTLIEVARTMLADSKLPITFWAEAINTACYVQNRVLVIKPHNKTPYELFLGSGPKWLFDIDTLTKSMNYKPVVTRNQSNGSADPQFSSSLKDSPDAGFKPSREEDKKDVEDPGNEDSEVSSTEELRLNQEKDANVNSTNSINTVSSADNATGIEDNVVDENIIYRCADDPNMPNLEEIVYSDDDEDVDAEVWTLMDLPNGKRAIGTKYKNKKDERGIVIKNKERLIAQGYTQEEGIDYDEVFALVAGIEVIRLFLAYASFKDFVVYQMDAKSAFLYGKIEEEVYVYQPSGFEDPDFPNRTASEADGRWDFYKSSKNVTEILKKFSFSDVKTASTPMETHKPLFKDADGEDVDEHLNRSMIGSLMYLTSSRPNIMFAVCVCARFQVNPKSSHLHAVKRIFRYLKSQPKLGLWYPKNSPFDLVAYIDSDYAGASLDRKSTIGGC